MQAGTLMTGGEFDRMPVVERRKVELLEGEVLEASSAAPMHNDILMLLST